MTDKYTDGQPCKHPGCLSHVSHPCEGCGRIAGRYPKATYTDLKDADLDQWALNIVQKFEDWRFTREPAQAKAKAQILITELLADLKAARVEVERLRKFETMTLAKKAAEWVASPEGHAALKKAVEESDRTIKKLEEARKIDPELLRRPFDI